MNVEDLVTQVAADDEPGVSLGNLTRDAQNKAPEQKRSKCWGFFCCSPCFGRGPKPSSPMSKHLAPPLPSKLATQVPAPSPTATASPSNNTANSYTATESSSPSSTPRPGQSIKKYLLPPLSAELKNRKCLVLDLDETLVHSSFKPIPNADFVISIELENVIHRVYVRKRPGVDAFMKAVGEKFEVVVFTASLAKYADPLLDILDRHKVIHARLFREACVQHYGNYVKDLSHLGRPLESCIILDNSPFSYMFQPDNAIPITSWFNDKSDRQLYELLPFLDHLTTVDDVCSVLARKKQMSYISQSGTPPSP